jgi:phosphatidylglycerol:prolipoprotein diacylglycerol transferase
VELLTALAFLAIDIDIDPTLTDIGPFTLTWHGLFTAVGIIGGVSLSVWLGKRDGIPPEFGQEIALVGVPCAIVGARLFFVIEHWDNFSGDLPSIIFDITEGGITLYGGLIGGALGGLAYGIWRKWPVGIALDCAAPGMILGQGIGRIGDLINGEHLATASDLPWAVRYVHPDTLGEIGRAVHPTAGGYELIGDLAILALLLFVARRWITVPGWSFCLYVIVYGVMRFWLSEFRLDEETAWDIPLPQITSAVMVAIAVMGAGLLVRHPGTITREWRARMFGDAGAPPPRATSGASAG